MSPSAESSWRPAAAPSRDPIVPWAVKAEHRWARPLAMLRIESRRRAGFDVPGEDLDRLSRFRSELAQRNLVVHYEPRTGQGWWLVPRRRGIDADLIREPDAADAAGHPWAAGAIRGRTALAALAAALLPAQVRHDLWRPRNGGLRTVDSSGFGRAGSLLRVGRHPITGTWRAYLDPSQQPPRRRLLRAVRRAAYEYEIGWETGPFLDGHGRLYFDATPRRGFPKLRAALEVGSIDRSGD